MSPRHSHDTGMLYYLERRQHAAESQILQVKLLHDTLQKNQKKTQQKPDSSQFKKLKITNSDLR